MSEIKKAVYSFERVAASDSKITSLENVMPLYQLKDVLKASKFIIGFNQLLPIGLFEGSDKVYFADELHDEFHRETGYIHFGQFYIFEI